MRLSKLITFLMVLTLMLSITSCAVKQPDSNQNTTEPESSRSLKLSAVPNENIGYTVIPSEELNGNFSEDIVYWNFTDVTIEVDGARIPLEEAIRDGKITTAEILAFARIDSKNGVCKETYSTEHGLTCFLYSYPEFDVHLIYDVYATPDGQQHLIEDLSIYPRGKHSNTNHQFLDEESQYGYFLDREDWGIDFEVSSVTPTSLTVNCIQSGGQQIGELEVNFYYNIYSVIDEQTSLLDSQGEAVVYTQDSLPSPIAKIKQNATTQFTIDWSEKYGELESGEYRIKLSISDIFDESQVHPLMQDYYTSQGYWIEFTIP